MKIIKFTELFFEKRFPEKNIQLEKDCGYFWEWAERFKGNNPQAYMDEISLKVFEEIKEELIKTDRIN